MDDGLENLGTNRERVPLKHQALAVLTFIQAAQDAMDSAKVAAENMDAEQANAHLEALRRPSRTLMAVRQGLKEAVAQWTALTDQLPAVIVLEGLAKKAEDRTGRYEPPNKCKGCGGSRKRWDHVLDRFDPCPRCKGSGQEPKPA